MSPSPTELFALKVGDLVGLWSAGVGYHATLYPVESVTSKRIRVAGLLFDRDLGHANKGRTRIEGAEHATRAHAKAVITAAYHQSFDNVSTDTLVAIKALLEADKSR